MAGRPFPKYPYHESKFVSNRPNRNGMYTIFFNIPNLYFNKGRDEDVLKYLALRRVH